MAFRYRSQPAGLTADDLFYQQVMGTRFVYDEFGTVVELWQLEHRRVVEAQQIQRENYFNGKYSPEPILSALFPTLAPSEDPCPELTELRRLFAELYADDEKKRLSKGARRRRKRGENRAAELEEAATAAAEMLRGASFGDAGRTVVVEELLEGEEASYFALLDGSAVVPLGSAQDHKAVGEGDTGPNTGGMGAYSPAPVVTPEVEARILAEIVQPLADGMVAEGAPYQGVLFAGVMVEPGTGAPRLLEVNVRFGDPECQCLLSRLRSDLGAVLAAAAEGGLGALPADALEWSPEAALLVVLAARGYPGAYAKGGVIGGLEAAAAAGAKVFHAGTAEDGEGRVTAAGGRVLGVTALGAGVTEAQEAAYAAVDAIQWEDGFCRRDIGYRAVAREARGE